MVRVSDHLRDNFPVFLLLFVEEEALSCVTLTQPRSPKVKSFSEENLKLHMLDHGNLHICTILINHQSLNSLMLMDVIEITLHNSAHALLSVIMHLCGKSSESLFCFI